MGGQRHAGRAAGRDGGRLSFEPRPTGRLWTHCGNAASRRRRTNSWFTSSVLFAGLLNVMWSSAASWFASRHLHPRVRARETKNNATAHDRAIKECDRSTQPMMRRYVPQIEPKAVDLTNDCQRRVGVAAVIPREH